MLIQEEEEKKAEIEEEEKKSIGPDELASAGEDDKDWEDENSSSMKSDVSMGELRRQRERIQSFGDRPRSRGPISESDSDNSIDLDNLPEDRAQRFELLGIDPSILDCGEEQLIMVTEASAIEEILKKQEIKRKERAE